MRSNFHPHMNHALGHYVHTRKDYLRSMKEKGLEPFHVVTRPESKPYKPSRWAHDMVRTIKRSTDKDGKVHLGSVALSQLQSNLKAVPKELLKLKENIKGGFYASKER